jgi:hypothetical protein
MNRAALCILLAALVGATAAAAQHDGAGGGVADVPSGPARIHGRILREAHPNEVGGIEVVLYALPQGGAPGLRRARSEPDGSFAFERITNDPGTAYLVGARVGEVPFPGERVSFEAGVLDRAVEIRVAEPTTDAARVATGEAKLRLDWAGGRLVVSESHRLQNDSDRVFYVPVAERGRLAPAFRTALPPGASHLTGPLGVLPEGFVERDGALVFFGPIYPGPQELSFSYALPLGEGAMPLRKRFPAGTPAATVLVAERGPTVAAPALRPGDDLTLDGRRYRTLVSGALRPGAELALDVTLPAAQSDPASLSVEEVRVFLEQDAAALTVREDHRLSVAGDRMLVSPAGAPLYRMALPESARDIRFATEPPGIPLLPSEDGAITVAGPLPAGVSEIEILYHVPVEGGVSRIALESSRAVPLLSVFAADTGLDLRSERLHRRRPVRTEDRTYLHLEAFELEPGEKVALEVVSLTRAPGASRSLALAATVLTAAAVGAFLIGPLRGSADDRPTAETKPEPAGLREREALYAALRDLEEDYETGKLSEVDHALLRDELRARAAALLQAERSGATQEPATPAAPRSPFCTRCGASQRPGDRFCAQCGTALEGATAAAREASA